MEIVEAWLDSIGEHMYCNIKMLLVLNENTLG